MLTNWFAQKLRFEEEEIVEMPYALKCSLAQGYACYVCYIIVHLDGIPHLSLARKQNLKYLNG